MRMCQAESGPSSPDERKHSAIPATRSQWKIRTPRSQTRMRRGVAADSVTIAPSFFAAFLHAPADHRLTARSARPPHLRGGAKTAAIKTNTRRAGENAGPPEHVFSGSRPDRQRDQP